MAEKKSQLGSIVVWTWPRTVATIVVILLTVATIVVILLLVPYVSGWLAFAAWFVFGWHCLSLLVDLINFAVVLNKAGDAMRARRAR